MREEIIMEPGMKGIIVCAKCAKKTFFSPIDRKWIILVESVKSNNDLNCVANDIIRWVSYCVETDEAFINTNIPQCWGNTTNYKFYLATNEEKQIIKDIIRRNKFKYVKALNKLIRR